MQSLATQWRRLKKNADYVLGYVRFDRSGNNIVRRTNFSDCPRPVLLLYGFMSTRRVFEVLEARLRRDKFCVWSINLGGLFDAFNTLGIETTAQKVAEKIDRLYERFPGMGPLSIIGHSMGGLIARYYVQKLNGNRRVHSVVTLATPHNGSRSAYYGCLTYGIVSKGIWQMLPTSRFIQDLNSTPFPHDVRLTSIYSRADKVNRFPDCLVDPTVFPNAHNFEVPDVKHREFVVKRDVYKIVREELAAGYGAQLGELDAVTGSELVRVAS